MTQDQHPVLYIWNANKEKNVWNYNDPNLDFRMCYKTWKKPCQVYMTCKLIVLWTPDKRKYFF